MCARYFAIVVTTVAVLTPAYALAAGGNVRLPVPHNVVTPSV
jgi:hypothetical protein